jgi:hypothetical protein
MTRRGAAGAGDLAQAARSLERGLRGWARYLRCDRPEKARGDEHESGGGEGSSGG